MDTKTPKKRKNRLPIVAFIFALAPALWLPFYLPDSNIVFNIISVIFLSLFLISFFGMHLQTIGLILGIIGLIVTIRRRDRDIRSMTFSIIAILAPFVWIFVLVSGGFEYIMSYK